MYFYDGVLMIDGVLLALIRLCEPVIWTNLKADISSWCRCCCKQPKRSSYAKETLDSFLNSAMNIEYVYLLLVGISTYYDTQNKDGAKFKIEVDKDQAKIIFNTVEMKQAAQWNVDMEPSEITTSINSVSQA